MFEFGIKNVAFLIIFIGAGIFFATNVKRLIDWLENRNIKNGCREKPGSRP